MLVWIPWWIGGTPGPSLPLSLRNLRPQVCDPSQPTPCLPLICKRGNTYWRWQYAWLAYGNTRGVPMAIRVACLCQYAWRAYANTRGLPMATRVACLCQYAWRAYANTRGVPRRAAPSVVVNWATGPASHRLQTAARAPAVIGRCVSRAPAETRLHHIGSATPHEIVV